MATAGLFDRTPDQGSVMTLTNETRNALTATAWEVRERARLIGETAVGCAVATGAGTVFSGCNVEHRFRSHDIHAETNALGSMIASGDGPAAAVFIAAERSHFTPCGACLDWIFELGGEDCLVLVQSVRGGPITEYRAGELMPFYPY